MTAIVKRPVLVPAAVVLGVLLVVAGERTWLNPVPLRQLHRSIPWHQSLQVTASEATVRAEPNTRSAVVATLQRGTRVEVGAEEHEWYHVALSDGSEGWVERAAFE